MNATYKSCMSNLHICKANCCKNGVWVDAEEAKRIQAEVLKRDSLADLHDKVLWSEEDEDTDYFPTGKGVGTNLQSPEGPCIFLGTDYKCRIYEFRPNFCADYPFMHPLATSSKPVLIDNMFESDPNCIYNTLLSATLKSIEEEREADAKESAAKTP